MVIQTDGDFLGRRMSGIGLREHSITYSDNVSDDTSDSSGSNPASAASKGGFAIVDRGNQLDDNTGGAIVVVAVVELGNDGVALAVEGVEGVLDVDIGPLRNDLGDSPSQGHSTGSDDNEVSRETHYEEV